MKKSQFILHVQNAVFFLLGLTVLLFPIVVTQSTTDPYVLPKKIVLIAFSLLAVTLWSVIQVLQKSIVIHKSKLAMTLLFFVVVAIISTCLSISPSDSAVWTIPFMSGCIIAFLFTQMIMKKEQLQFLLMSMAVSTGAIAIMSIFSYFHIYLLPFSFTHNAAFSPLGGLIDQAVIFTAALAVCVRFLMIQMRKKIAPEMIMTAIGVFIYLAGLTVTLYQVFTTQKPIVMPFAPGFQISFAALSQDTTRMLQSFLFGSGPDTYYMDFTRFKQASFNADNSLWYLSFTSSTSFLLGQVATMGLFGIASLLLIIGTSLTQIKRHITNPLGMGVLVMILGISVLPINFVTFVFFIFSIALFDAALHSSQTTERDTYEFSLVTKHKQQFNFSTVLPIGVLVILLALSAAIGWATTTYVLSDVYFQQSLVAANANNANITYKKQLDAIKMFPYRDAYYRVFAQTNLSLANALIAASNAQKGASPSATVQQQTLQLIQQSISSARMAESISPMNDQNWQNVGNVYQVLIGFGQNAETFAISADQQAITLNPTNPQGYLTLGGVYYQLQQWDNAIRAFQNAANLKPDYPNAYYNLGHAYEQKGDLQSALQAYQAVEQLVKSNPENLHKIQAEITTVQAKMGTKGQGTTQKQPDQQQTQTPAQITPAAQQPLQVQSSAGQPQTSPAPLAH